MQSFQSHHWRGSWIDLAITQDYEPIITQEPNVIHGGKKTASNCIVLSNNNVIFKTNENYGHKEVKCAHRSYIWHISVMIMKKDELILKC